MILPYCTMPYLVQTVSKFQKESIIWLMLGMPPGRAYCRPIEVFAITYRSFKVPMTQNLQKSFSTTVIPH